LENSRLPPNARWWILFATEIGNIVAGIDVRSLQRFLSLKKRIAGNFPSVIRGIYTFVDFPLE
jgi:hypothetical protein